MTQKAMSQKTHIYENRTPEDTTTERPHWNVKRRSFGENTRPRGYKTLFGAQLTEHENFPANKPHITDSCKSFLLNMAEHENFSANKNENSNNV